MQNASPIIGHIKLPLLSHGRVAWLFSLLCVPSSSKCGHILKRKKRRRNKTREGKERIISIEFGIRGTTLKMKRDDGGETRMIRREGRRRLLTTTISWIRRSRCVGRYPCFQLERMDSLPGQRRGRREKKEGRRPRWS